MAHGLPRKSSTNGKIYHNLLCIMIIILGSVERANQCVENIIITFQSEHGTTDWAGHLGHFQLMKNNRYSLIKYFQYGFNKFRLHKGIGKTPYEAVFGRKINSLPSQQFSSCVLGEEETVELAEEVLEDEASFAEEVEDDVDENVPENTHGNYRLKCLNNVNFLIKSMSDKNASPIIVST